MDWYFCFVIRNRYLFSLFICGIKLHENGMDVAFPVLTNYSIIYGIKDYYQAKCI